MQYKEAGQLAQLTTIVAQIVPSNSVSPDFIFHIISYFIFDLFREGSPSTKVVFQRSLQ